MPHILDALTDRVLLCDGAMGTEAQARKLDIERDYGGHENYIDLLCETRPDVVRDAHLGHLHAGADAIETNSFGGSAITAHDRRASAAAQTAPRRPARRHPPASKVFHDLACHSRAASSMVRNTAPRACNRSINRSSISMRWPRPMT